MIVAVCFTLMKPYKDAAACGLGGCCIITHNIGYIEDISEDGNKKPEKLEGDTSDDDEFPVEDDEKSPDQDIESSFDDFDDDDYHQLPIINYERHQALLVAPGDPTSPTAGTEDKYARDGGGNNGGGDLELATDSDLVSNNSKDADDGPAWDNANDGTNANQEEKATNGMPATTTTRDGEPSTGNAAGKDDGNVDSGATVHSGSPDFLDTMCCGDPLELEKYMSGKICVSKNGSSNKNKKTKKDGRKQDAYTKRSEPLRASLRKIALVTEASNREKRTIYVGNPPPGGKL